MFFQKIIGEDKIFLCQATSLTLNSQLIFPVSEQRETIFVHSQAININFQSLIGEDFGTSRNLFEFISQKSF
jgi:hypothetical protein